MGIACNTVLKDENLGIARDTINLSPVSSPRLAVNQVVACRRLRFTSCLSGLSRSTGIASLSEQWRSSQGALESRLARPVELVNVRDHDRDKMKQFLTSLRDARVIGSPTLTLGRQASSGD